MTHPLRPLVLCAAALVFAACKDNDTSSGNGNINQPPSPLAALNAIDTAGAPDGIVDLPASIPAVIGDVFARYSQVTIPNAGRIHFLAQSGVTDGAHFRARKVVEQHLANVANTTYGADKAAVREGLANLAGTFVLFRDAASADPAAPGVAPFAAAFPGFGQLVMTEAIVEGTPEYLAAMPAYDATIARTARFVVARSGAALAPFRADLAARAADAQSASLYVPDPASQDIEGDFLGRAIEVYYGLWGHDPLGNGTAGAGDSYAFHTRLAMEAGDPQTLALVESFFASFHTYAAYLPDGFTGTFETAFDPATPYTHRSRYLSRVGLRGTTGARLEGNVLDGTYLGSLGDDEFLGGGGNDFIEGGSTADFDRAFYSGPSTEYTIGASPLGGGATQVLDQVGNRDGTDQLRFIEQLVFTDMTVDL